MIVRKKTTIHTTPIPEEDSVTVTVGATGMRRGTEEEEEEIEESEEFKEEEEASEDEEEKKNPPSIVQMEEHPSLSCIFPSSHSSPTSVSPLPQAGGAAAYSISHAPEQPSPSVVFPSSHSSGAV